MDEISRLQNNLKIVRRTKADFSAFLNELYNLSNKDNNAK